MILLFLASICNNTHPSWDQLLSLILSWAQRRGHKIQHKRHTLSNRCNGNLQVLHVWTSKCSCSLMFYLSFYLGCQVHLYHVSRLSFWCAFPWWETGRLTAEDSAGHSKCPLPLTLPVLYGNVIYCGFEGTALWLDPSIEMTKQALAHN